MVSCYRFPIGTDKKDVKPRQAEPVSTKYRTDNYSMRIGCIADW